MVINGYLWLLMCISIVQWLLVVISDIENNLFFIYFKTMVIMVIDGYRWLFVVINVYLKIAMVILVIGGYQWLLVTLSD